MNSLRKIVGAHADLMVIALVMGVLIILFAPIPSVLLDVLILLNVALALLVLLMTFYAPRPADFSTFPAVLLIATLFRLALNVSATRLILMEGDAGRVIQSVGTYVVGGNYVVGIIVFLILVVVQYVVVTNGAQRVSEVAARFTLDSMPGPRAVGARIMLQPTAEPLLAGTALSAGVQIPSGASLHGMGNVMFSLFGQWRPR